MKINTYLPIFSGFYNTVWQLDYDYIEEVITQDRKKKGLYSEYDFNDLKIDNSSFESDVVKLFCNELPDFMQDFINNVELEKIVFPKKYNFSNDSANVIIDTNIENIRDFIYKHESEFKEHLKNRYTSYDGFISGYSNNFEDWKADTKDFKDFSINGHCLGSILEFIAHTLEIREFDLYYSLTEGCGIDFYSYIENLDELFNKVMCEK